MEDNEQTLYNLHINSDRLNFGHNYGTKENKNLYSFTWIWFQPSSSLIGIVQMKGLTLKCVSFCLNSHQRYLPGRRLIV